MTGGHRGGRLSFGQWLRYQRYYLSLRRDARKGPRRVTEAERRVLKKMAREVARRVDE